jgi:hypothetical protein
MRNMPAQDACCHAAVSHSPRRNAVVRFVKWWASLTLLLGPLSVCPICGQQGCGGGLLSAGVLGAFGAALTVVPKWLAGRFRRHSDLEGAET